MNQEKIGKFMASLRKEKGLTQSAFGNLLGVSDRTVSNWETGRNMPDLSLFKPICDVLGVSINDLLSGEVVKDNKENRMLENIVNIIDDKKKKERKKLIKTILISLFLVIIIFAIIFTKDIRANEKFKSYAYNFKDTTKIIVGDYYLQNSDDYLTYKNIKYPILTVIDNQDDVKKIIDIMLNLKYQESVGKVIYNDNVPRYTIKLLNENNEVIAITNLNEINFNNRVNYQVNIDEEYKDKLLDIFYAFDRVYEEIALSLKDTHKIVVKDVIKNKFTKEITNEDIIKRIIDIIGDAKSSNDDALEYAKYELYFYDINEDLLKEISFNGKLHITEKDKYSLNTNNFKRDELFQLVEN